MRVWPRLDGSGTLRQRVTRSLPAPSVARAALTDVSLSIPVIGGAPALGTWQAIYVIEHRTMPHRRELALHFLGCFADDGG